MWLEGVAVLLPLTLSSEPPLAKEADTFAFLEPQGIWPKAQTPFPSTDRVSQVVIFVCLFVCYQTIYYLCGIYYGC